MLLTYVLAVLLSVTVPDLSAFAAYVPLSNIV